MKNLFTTSVLCLMAMALCLKATAQYDEFKDPFEGEMVFVEGGTFTMGCTDEQGKSCKTIEKPAHEVTVGSFYIAKYEVTIAQWAYVMERTDAATLSKWGEHPATDMTWKYANDFIDTLRHYTGKKYRLPTEAEWEFAARGGNLSKGYKYAGSDKVLEVAHCTAQRTERVGQYKPNELGLYDMSGNVWEWCSDWYDYYDEYPQTNPKGPDTGVLHVFRGGGWDDDTPSFCRVSCRYNEIPASCANDRGFRIVLDVE